VVCLLLGDRETCMKRTLFLLTCLPLMAFTNPDISRSLAAGAVGCPPDQIGIANETSTSGVHNFTAYCRGVEYFCSYLYPAPISCKARSDQTPEQIQEAAAERTGQMVTWRATALQKAHAAWKKPKELDKAFSCELAAKVDDRGRLLNLRWVRETGVSSSLDRSVINAFKDASPFEPPPDPGAAFAGVVFSFADPEATSDVETPKGSAPQQ
jgi:hypothetical protein